MSCPACPFAMTDHSESVQNLACLPTPYEVMRLMRDQGKRWCCHENEARACAGQVEYCRGVGIPYDKTLPLASYESWYHDGVA